MVTRAASVPSAPAVAVPSGTETKLQQVPVQLTRLPTTVDHWRSTDAPGVRPLALRSTFDSTIPAEELRRAVASPPAARPVAWSVVFASSVGATFTGQSRRGAGRPGSFVTLNLNSSPVPQGIGDCSMFRYLKLIASATSIVCMPTGPFLGVIDAERATRKPPFATWKRSTTA